MAAKSNRTADIIGRRLYEAVVRFAFGIPGGEVPRLIDYAFECLSVGGHILVHDFMVEDDRTGPPLAALWQLQHMAFTPEARSVTPGWLKERMENAGFREIREEEMVPGMTRLVHARKPG